MKHVNNILVALDLSEIDTKLVSYGSALASKLNAQNVYFVHNIKKNQFSELFKEKLKNIDLEAVVENQIQKIITQEFKADVNSEILIGEDFDTVALLQHIARSHSIDLVIVGNKNKKEGLGVVSSKLLHTLRCDIISVNQEAKVPTGKFLCTTDFSKNSIRAINKAIDISENFGKREITCLNVYKIPQLFFPYIDEKESLKDALKDTESKFQKMIKKMDNPEEIKPIIISADNLSITQRIKKFSRDKEFELIFISGKGQNSFNTLLVGSVTESLFTSKSQVPIWIVR